MTEEGPVCKECGQPVTRDSRTGPWRHVQVPKDRHRVQRVVWPTSS